jgi:hypothetical protein
MEWLMGEQPAIIKYRDAAAAHGRKRKGERWALSVCLMRERIEVEQQRVAGAGWNTEDRKIDRKRKRDEWKKASERATVVEDEIESLARVSMLDDLGQEEYEGEIGEHEARESEAMRKTQWNRIIGGVHKTAVEWNKTTRKWITSSRSGGRPRRQWFN